MKNHPLAVLILVGVVLSAGCATLISAGDSSASTDTPVRTTVPTTAADRPDTSMEPATQPATPTAEQTLTPTAEQTQTPYPAWSQPRPPNRHLENKIEPGRVPDVQFVNTEPGPTGAGYANFDLEVTADTRMENVDPPEHGDVEGEPYFIVYINEIRFARLDNVQMRDNGTFTVRMKKRGLEQFERGELDVKVRLLDEDSQWDDIYGVWTGTVEYDPD